MPGLGNLRRSPQARRTAWREGPEGWEGTVEVEGLLCVRL